MFSIRNLTKKPLPVQAGVLFQKIADKILGQRYELSLVLCGDAFSRRLNREYRGKDYPTNVLAFPIDDKNGEIFINLMKTAQEADNFSRSDSEHLTALFIHGALHLKGFTHGSTMESQENKLFKLYSTDGQKHRHRSRRRDVNHSRRRKRI